MQEVMQEVFDKVKHKMDKTVNNFMGELAAQRVGRANPAVLDRIVVDYYGAPTPINQMAAVSVVEARILMIQPWDVSSLRAIEKAIQTSDLGINPQNDGKVIRLTFPPMTEERRREVVKEVAKLAEESKIAIRSIRRDAIEKLKALQKNAEITEDDLKHAEKKVQDLTDSFCKEISELAEKKDKEIMAI